MSKLIPFFLFVFMSVVTSHSNAVGLKSVWAKGGFKTPESVFYDEKHQLLFVSNMDGEGDVKDSKGFISKLKPSGEIVQLEWVSGLHSPKGMAVSGSSLFVSDIDVLVEIHIATGRIKHKYQSDAKFLNDVVLSEKGDIYVSDTFGHKLYKLENGKLETWLTHELVQWPNGLEIIDDTMYLGVSGNIVAINLNSKNVKHYAKHDGGNITDGLKHYKDKAFFMSNWNGSTWLVGKEHSELLLDTTELKINAADMEYIEKDNLIVIPTFSDNRLAAYSILKDK